MRMRMGIEIEMGMGIPLLTRVVFDQSD